MKQVVIWGSPCSGKSTYVSSHMQDGDLRYDFDLLKSAITNCNQHMASHGRESKLIFKFRHLFCKETAEMESENTAYIIATTLSSSLTGILSANAEFVKMEASEAECLQRLAGDDTRPDKESWAAVIHNWFASENNKEKSKVKIELTKAAQAAAATISDGDMAAINAQAKTPLTPDEVYVFRCEACNDQVDRDFERFTLDALRGLAELYVGKTMIYDHCWTAGGQIARIYKSEVAVDPADNIRHRLMLYCYMLRNDSTKDTIAAIEGGILREVSVGCAMGSARCSICGEEYGSCGHVKGQTYDGKLCVCELDDPLDAYEMSFVAVPSQPHAGITKQIQKTGWTTDALYAAKARLKIEHERMKFSNVR